MKGIIPMFIFVFTSYLVDGQKTDSIPPGEMIDIGGYQLHLLAKGKKNQPKGPCVVFFHGAGDVALHWNLVLPKVGKFACAVAIDQNGEAWSQHGPSKSLKQNVHESFEALKKGGYPPPYILVGHSLGGIQALLFAEKYPTSVAGVILVDATHPDVVLKVFNKEKKQANWQQFRLTANEDIPEIIPLPSLEKMEIKRVKIKRDFGTQLRPFKNRDRRRFEWLYNERLFSYVPGRGNDFSAEILEEMYQHKEKYHLGDKPLLVISGGKKTPPTGDSNWSTQRLIAHSKMLQLDLLSYSSRSKQIIAKKSGHHIHLDQTSFLAKQIRKFWLLIK